jgi:predicted transcriptional regulator YdeE
MLVNVKATTLFGIKETGPSSFNTEEKSGSNFGAQLWGKFIPLLVSSGISLNRKMYGVSWPADNATPPQIINYFVGIEFEDILVDGVFEKLELIGGNYFKFEYSGPSSEIDKGFLNAYMNAFPDSGLSPRDGQHLEVYPVDFDPSASLIQFEILIPVI